MILFSGAFSGSATDVVQPRLPGGRTCVRYAGAERLRVITRERLLSGIDGGLRCERATFVIIMLAVRSSPTSDGVMPYSVSPRDWREVAIGEEWGRGFCSFSLCALKSLRTCAFILFNVLSWCFIRGGALEILCGKLTLRSNVGVFICDGGLEGKLSLVSARMSLCARTWERASLRGGVFA